MRWPLAAGTALIAKDVFATPAVVVFIAGWAGDDLFNVFVIVLYTFVDESVSEAIPKTLQGIEEIRSGATAVSACIEFHGDISLVGG